MRCDHCGKRGAAVRKTNRVYGAGATLHVIENVPAVHCPNCGETYYTAETLHELERLKTHRKALFIKRPVAVTSYR
ncbi:MAG: type II toxin-antitoxin system MqsA family antitoxin [Candidatus Hydrogenedentes bacterium]|nr:type II toxin-antitoxin system MqsA family antitoxin [Candidatus Hydrogenedentota bacterium]